MKKAGINAFALIVVAVISVFGTRAASNGTPVAPETVFVPQPSDTVTNTVFIRQPPDTVTITDTVFVPDTAGALRVAELEAELVPLQRKSIRLESPRPTDDSHGTIIVEFLTLDGRVLEDFTFPGGLGAFVEREIRDTAFFSADLVRVINTVSDQWEGEVLFRVNGEARLLVGPVPKLDTDSVTCRIISGSGVASC